MDTRSKDDLAFQLWSGINDDQHNKAVAAIENGADIDNPRYESHLATAATHSRIDTFLYLLMAGAEFDIMDKSLIYYVARLSYQMTAVQLMMFIDLMYEHNYSNIEIIYVLSYPCDDQAIYIQIIANHRIQIEILNYIDDLSDTAKARQLCEFSKNPQHPLGYIMQHPILRDNASDASSRLNTTSKHFAKLFDRNAHKKSEDTAIEMSATRMHYLYLLQESEVSKRHKILHSDRHRKTLCSCNTAEELIAFISKLKHKGYSNLDLQKYIMPNSYDKLANKELVNLVYDHLLKCPIQQVENIASRMKNANNNHVLGSIVMLAEQSGIPNLKSRQDFIAMPALLRAKTEKESVFVEDSSKLRFN